MSHFERYAESVKRAEAIYNGQFYTKSAKKNAMDWLNRAYSELNDYAQDCYRARVKEELGTDYRYMSPEYQAFRDANPSDDTPYDLHNVREAKHAEFYRTFGQVWVPINNLVELRAFYKEAEILFFDEATSALDNETEANLMYSINNLKGEQTIILIAHRLSTIKNFDKIEVFLGKFIFFYILIYRSIWG
mgnify:CR=1 FL=1